ncbi:bifunctional phosphopantothenoylcysteine decarboxylase/phosphopantothenate--cysteine ligase CoaBC [Psychrobacter sp. Sarcosine-02u-2]|jgi:phosphopantothenoylcysteine decarboxylase/phosphopantothenate--cysteine ligase|uniref:Coenzyme A biosynthesis bifunctional protein CoaBC n=1 Tax=Psychrobacter faecalis TaxID=180588 RepID=A0ABT9HIN0_9GAMM|nr:MULTISPECIES: bifunctional phosphopantothenoylcysteine decarboxylase/phosphopantothenate--cysteine ligase CoaBC [Psychrobacter]MCG3861659.1 bifunctional phosphopantothenoylcysteine decarboxylase/phosphopantothenate--cysteine ligase CoaBC [Psychrobacter sp. Ps5]MDP4545621.1 bifunctional phosphopantothenoylcysteine decarboxylase/phosphopantothenate--cysteine ligase CoaBC [Psychrobacter faecalis]OAP72449.1 phosphopantothenoylcysteine decarboxylase [Psychrobacter sp. SHUES1]PKG86136.1 bifunction
MSNIVLAITGGIAAYKSAIFARLLVKAGFDVRVIMTTGAQAFITPLTLQALTGNEVHISLLDEQAEAGMGHIELAKWADLIVIAPASANTLARLAMGMADDLLTTVCLATTAPVIIAPAMNQQMWAHPAVNLNVQTLRDMNYQIIAPASGEQACGDVGAGRLPEPEDLLAEVQLFTAMQTTPQLLAGKRVVITAGPTVEGIDPVRYLSNHSTGKMGFALARACVAAGAEVILIAGGKVALPTPLNVTRIDVLSAQDMLIAAQQCVNGTHSALQYLPEDADEHSHEHSHDHSHHHDDCGCGEEHQHEHAENESAGIKVADIFIATAAVADYRTLDAAPQKIKKTQDAMTLNLVKNPDILATISLAHPELFVVGFAAETQDVERYARGKLLSKDLDLIACNDVSRADIGFASDDNAMQVFFSERYEHDNVILEKASKDEIAEQLVTIIGETIWQRHQA